MTSRSYRPIARPLLIVALAGVAGALMVDGWRNAAPGDAAGVPVTVPSRFRALAVFRAAAKSSDTAAARRCDGGIGSSRPAGNPGTWLTADDYPLAALRAEHQGTVGMAFEVGPDGRVGACRVTSSSGHGELDAAACALITRRGRYVPARDAAGCPTAVSQTLRLTWRLPD